MFAFDFFDQGRRLWVRSNLVSRTDMSKIDLGEWRHNLMPTLNNVELVFVFSVALFGVLECDAFDQQDELGFRNHKIYRSTA